MVSSDIRHSISIVSRRTGLSPHAIRAWERRYGTVHPRRTDGNQRLYSEEDVERLVRLKQLTDAGHSIGNIAGLGLQELQLMAGADRIPPIPAVRGPEANLSANGKSGEPSPLFEQALHAVTAMDAARLHQVLENGALQLGQVALLTQVVAPLTTAIGDRWEKGELNTAHEHVATAVLRTFLGQAARPFAFHPSAPVIVSGTPTGQLHELGALLVGALAAIQGWRSVPAGASLPAEEFARIAQQSGARVVALSLVHPSDDPGLPQEFRRLRQTPNRWPIPESN
jgi:MerR family transcriptional regulator, light-induced transcriptional regulator